MDRKIYELMLETELSHWWFVGRRRILHRLIYELVSPSLDRLIIEVGCGTGANLFSLADEYECVGIDPCSTAIEFARHREPFDDRERPATEYDDAATPSFLCGYAPQDLGPLAGRASLYLLADVLEHVEDDQALLHDLINASSPGCWLLLTVPAGNELWSSHDKVHGHYRRYDLATFQSLWEDAPVQCKLVSYFNTRLYWPIRLIRTINRQLHRSVGAHGTDLRIPPYWLNRFLTNAFAHEEKVLVGLLHGACKIGGRRGVSLLAILSRNED